MFNGTEDDLKQTKLHNLQFLHSVILYKTLNDVKPDMVAGHSLGISALVANGVCLLKTGYD